MAAKGAAYVRKLGLCIPNSTMVTAFPPKITILLWFIVSIFVGGSLYAAPPNQPGGTAADRAVRISDVEDDGTVWSDKGTELVLAGLDQAYRLVPANGLYIALLREEQDRHPDWTVVEGRLDRYGRLTGQVMAGEGVWLQHHLIRRGAARFAGGVPEVKARRALLLAEEAARLSGAGLWGSGYWTVHDADAPTLIPSGFRIVTGTIRRVARVGRKTFLNFGEEWRTDFTVGSTLRAVEAPADASDPLPLRALEGKRVRVRGIVRSYNGPYLDLTAPDQIEVLGAPAE